jgi:hypothetical protein
MLTSKALKVLRWLAEDGDDEDGYERELICSGRSWMTGTHRLPAKVAMELLAHCCISRDSYSTDSFERFAINETGRKILAHPEKFSTLNNILASGAPCPPIKRKSRK